MALTLKQFHKLFNEKRPSGATERVNKIFAMARKKSPVKKYIKKMKKEMATKRDIDKIIAKLDGIARSHDAFKIKLVALKRVSLLRREKLLKDEL